MHNTKVFILNSRWSRGCTWYLGGYICSIWVGVTHQSMYRIFMLKPIPKCFAQNPSSYQFLFTFHCQTTLRAETVGRGWRPGPEGRSFYSAYSILFGLNGLSHRGYAIWLVNRAALSCAERVIIANVSSRTIPLKQSSPWTLWRLGPDRA